MALKLRRRIRRFTNESLSPLRSPRQLDSVRTGAGSFKRLLGRALPRTGAISRLETIESPEASFHSSTSLRIVQSKDDSSSEQCADARVILANSKWSDSDRRK